MSISLHDNHPSCDATEFGRDDLVPSTSAATIPTLSEWAQRVMAGLMILLGLFALRRWPACRPLSRCLEAGCRDMRVRRNPRNQSLVELPALTGMQEDTHHEAQSQVRYLADDRKQENLDGPSLSVSRRRDKGCYVGYPRVVDR